MRPRSLAAVSGVLALQKYCSEFQPTTGIPFAASAPATSLSMPAQPPSPERMTASVFPAPLAGTSTSGRPATDGVPFGAGGDAAAAAPFAAPFSPTMLWKASLNCGAHLLVFEKPWPTSGSSTVREFFTWAVYLTTSSLKQTWSIVPWKATHGCSRVEVGRKTTPFPLGPGSLAMPWPAQKGCASGRSGQKPMLIAPLKVEGGACASAA